jgi:uncharacterized protein with FMN-binding domain
MKRALLIAGGTVGSLGAVLAITPPQLGSQESGLALGGSMAPAANTGGTAQVTTEPTPAATNSATTKTTTSNGAGKNVNTTSTTTASPAATASATPSATKTTAPAATKSVSGTFTGDAINVSYGIVQVQITVNNGKITDAQAIQAPSGRNDRWTQMAIPVMRQKTLAAQSSQITGVSGASYTAYGWYKSLQSALTKAGLPL